MKTSYYLPFCWNRYAKKLTQAIKQPKHVGTAEEKPGCRVVTAHERDGNLANAIDLYLTVDEKEGKIVAAHYRVFGESALTGALEAVCELIEGKNYMQAKRITHSLVDKHFREKANEPAFPEEVSSHINLALFALEMAADQCLDIELPDEYFETPVDLEALGEGGEYPDWQALGDNERLSLIRQVVENDIRPYVELDEGGVTVTKLEEGPKVYIEYGGSCTSCYAATTSTLSAIQQILRAKVHPGISVTPEFPSPA